MASEARDVSSAPRTLVVGGPSPVILLFSVLGLLALAIVFVVGSWMIALNPEAVPDGSAGVRAEFVGLPAGLGMLVLVGLNLARLARTERAQRLLTFAVLAAVSVFGAISTVVFTLLAPGGWALAGGLPAAATAVVGAMVVRALRSPWIPAAGEAIVLPPESRWHPLSPRLRRLLPVPPVLVALSCVAMATVTVLPEQSESRAGGWDGEWLALPGFMLLITVLVSVGAIALATAPDKSLVRYRYPLVAKTPMVILTVITGAVVTTDLIETDDRVTMACGLLSLAWMVTLLMVVFAGPRRAPAVSPW